MRITIVRSGGVAGFRQHVEVDTHDLPEEQVAHLRQLVATVGVVTPSDDPTSPSDQASPPDAVAVPRAAPTRGADRFQYDVTVVSGGSERRLRTREDQGSPEVTELVAAVWAIARGDGGGSAPVR